MLNIVKVLFLFTVFSFGSKTTVPIAVRSLSPHHSNQENSGKFALLIGIDDYENGIPPLKGAVADVSAMSELLSGEKFGFPKNQIRLLSNREATGENIIKTFREHLITTAKNYFEKTGSEATIYFHFSGHGSQAAPPDFMTKTDEPDGFDETIVPIDSGRNGNAKGFDIKDDEIHALATELSKYTTNAVFVFDSCNSGTVSRGESASRETTLDTRKQPDYRIASASDKGPLDKNYDDLLIANDRFVMIAGTRSSRKSYEIKLPDGTYRGALSFYLERSLRNASPQTSYGELIRRVAIEVNHHNSDQEPQISGDARRLVLGGRFEDGEIPIHVIDVDIKTKTLTIGAGGMSGIRRGSFIAIENKEGTRVAEAEVVEIGRFKSVARYTILGGGAISKNSNRAVLLSPLFGSEPVEVRLMLAPESKTDKSNSAGNAILRGVAAELKKESGELVKVDLVEPGAGGSTDVRGINVAGISVKRSGFRDAFCGSIVPDNVLKKSDADARCGMRLPLPKMGVDGKTALPLPKEDEEVFYIAPDESGEPIFDFFVRTKDREAVSKISKALRKYARQKNLLALSNTDNPLSGNLEIEFIEVKGHFDDEGYFVEDSKSASTLGERSSFAAPEGTFYRLRITNKSQRSLYLTVLGLSNDGAITAMFPENNQEPLIRNKSIETGLYLTSRPYGTEWIKVIATNSYSDFTGLSQGAVSKDPRTASSPISRLIEQAMQGKRSKGNENGLALDSNTWGVAEVSLEITHQ